MQLKTLFVSVTVFYFFLPAKAQPNMPSGERSSLQFSAKTIS